MLRALLVGALVLAMSGVSAPAATFAVGEKDFLLDGKPVQIRCGEVHFMRVPREYWRDRLKRCRAMGLNAVCAYLFWNRHEWERGKFDWDGQADAAAFCKIAQEEGLMVVLRPGPYACAEWEMGGLPWWLLKKPDIQLRTRDADFMAASKAWLTEVGRVLGPMQVTRGGPIVMVQVENEYGSYGKDADYVRDLRTALTDAGFDVPLFACNPPNALKNGLVPDLFQVVNFGKDPAGGFAALRNVQKTGPLMCGEFYPGWFDTWGVAHHRGETARYLTDLEYMLSHGASFSMYMAHGGTTFGMWSGTDRPFKPDTSSYDYDAPISEAGWTGEKFRQTRELFKKYMAVGETLPTVPADNPVGAIAPFALTERTPVFANLGEAVTDAAPRNMEAYDQPRGCMVYRATLPAGPAATLDLGVVHDFAWVFVDGVQIGQTDRRQRRNQVRLPERKGPARLDVLVEAVGRVNFGKDVHDRKGLNGAVKLLAGGGSAGGAGGDGTPIGPWQVFRLPLDDAMLAGLKFEPVVVTKDSAQRMPAFWRGTFDIDTSADTFLDLHDWGKGVVWVNGHCLARYWNVGPTQTAYLPGPWLKAGKNEVVILDLVGPVKPMLSGVEKPVLDELRPGLDVAQRPAGNVTPALDGLKPAKAGTLPAGADAQAVQFDAAVSGRQFCLESVSAQDDKPFAAAAELEVLDADGKPLSHAGWSIAYVDSEELGAQDGSASNAIDGQSASAWHTATRKPPAAHPHRLVIDLGETAKIGGFRYTPPQGADATGRVKEYKAYVGDALVRKAG